jgi:hypothetical protein
LREQRAAGHRGSGRGPARQRRAGQRSGDVERQRSARGEILFNRLGLKGGKKTKIQTVLEEYKETV